MESARSRNDWLTENFIFNPFRDGLSLIVLTIYKSVINNNDCRIVERSTFPQMEGLSPLPESFLRIDALDRGGRRRARLGGGRWVFEVCRKDIFTTFDRPGSTKETPTVAEGSLQVLSLVDDAVLERLHPVEEDPVLL